MNNFHPFEVVGHGGETVNLDGRCQIRIEYTKSGSNSWDRSLKREVGCPKIKWDSRRAYIRRSPGCYLVQQQTRAGDCCSKLKAGSMLGRASLDMWSYLWCETKTHNLYITEMPPYCPRKKMRRKIAWLTFHQYVKINRDVIATKTI